MVSEKEAVSIRKKEQSIGITHCTKKMKFSIKDFFSKCDQIRSFLQIWSHSLKKSLIENFIFCTVKTIYTKTSYGFEYKKTAYVNFQLKCS